MNTLLFFVLPVDAESLQSAIIIILFFCPGSNVCYCAWLLPPAWPRPALVLPCWWWWFTRSQPSGIHQNYWLARIFPVTANDQPVSAGNALHSRSSRLITTGGRVCSFALHRLHAETPPFREYRRGAKDCATSQPASQPLSLGHDHRTTGPHVTAINTERQIGLPIISPVSLNCICNCFARKINFEPDRVNWCFMDVTVIMAFLSSSSIDHPPTYITVSVMPCSSQKTLLDMASAQSARLHCPLLSKNARHFWRNSLHNCWKLGVFWSLYYGLNS